MQRVNIRQNTGAFFSGKGMAQNEQSDEIAVDARYRFIQIQRGRNLKSRVFKHPTTGLKQADVTPIDQDG